MRRILLIAAAAAACGGDDGGGQSTRDGAPEGSDGGRPRADAGGLPGSCTFGEECPAEAPICDGDSHECAGCTQDSTCERFDALPWCRDGACVACAPADMEAPDFCPQQVCDGATGACRPCAAGVECLSGACNEGLCVEESIVLYVEPGGSTTSDCTPASPCGRVQRAIAVASGQRRFVHLAPGLYRESVLVNASNTADISGSLVLLGEAGSIVSPAGGNLAALRMRGPVDVSVVHLTLAGATGASGHGLDCLLTSPGQFDSSLFELTDAEVRDNAGAGVVSSGCWGTVRRTTVRGNGGAGIDFDGQYLLATGNQIRDNGGIGLRLRGCLDGSLVEQLILIGNQLGGASINCPIQIADSWLVRNGASDSAIGGARLDGASSIVLSTIADNRVASGASAAGVSCPGGAGWVDSSILVGGLGGPPEIAGCSVGHSLFAPGQVVDGPENFAGEPAFADPAAGDYDLGAASDAIDRAYSNSARDVHGDPRDFRPDVGGDEYHER